MLPANSHDITAGADILLQQARNQCNAWCLHLPACLCIHRSPTQLRMDCAHLWVVDTTDEVLGAGQAADRHLAAHCDQHMCRHQCIEDNANILTTLSMQHPPMQHICSAVTPVSWENRAGLAALRRAVAGLERHGRVVMFAWRAIMMPALMLILVSVNRMSDQRLSWLKRADVGWLRCEPQSVGPVSEATLKSSLTGC